jgi:hypothetical protein
MEVEVTHAEDEEGEEGREAGCETGDEGDRPQDGTSKADAAQG